jgi:hypothetical protein
MIIDNLTIAAILVCVPVAVTVLRLAQKSMR